MRAKIGNAFMGAAIVALSIGHVAPLSAQAKITTTGRMYKPAPPPETAPPPKSEVPSETEAAESQPQPEGPSGEDVAAKQSQPERPEPDASESELNLVCMGGGSANKPSVGTLNAWDNSGNYGGATIVGQRSQGFADEVRIRLNDDDPRLRMPRSMLPRIRGGEDGWFKLRNVEYGEGEITASIAVSLLNNPKLRLDRYTGGISISGKAGDFSGQCQRFDPEDVKKAF